MMYVLQLFLLWFFLTFMEIIAVMFFFFFTWCHEIHIFWLHILNTIREVQDKGEHVVALKCSRQYQTHQPETGFFCGLLQLENVFGIWYFWIPQFTKLTRNYAETEIIYSAKMPCLWNLVEYLKAAGYGGDLDRVVERGSRR